MNISVRFFTPSDFDMWDIFCEHSIQGTFLHTRRFLSYHGNRFKDCSLIIEENGTWLGVFPAAEDPSNNKCVVSHPGITYGGVLHCGKLNGNKMIDTLNLISHFFLSKGYLKLIYKAIPNIYHQLPAQDDSYAMFRIGANRTRCDLSCAINLNNQRSLNDRRKRSLKKAHKSEVKIIEGNQFILSLWEVITENISKKYNVMPVHSIAEINMLAGLFPNHIRCICALLNGAVVAGTILFITKTCVHAQYIASNDAGHTISALDAIFEECINFSKNNGKNWFDFGISNEDSGKYLNDGLYKFKLEFGGGGVVHEFYEISL